MKHLFYFLIVFITAGLVMVSTAKAADTLTDDQIAFKRGCQLTLASISLDDGTFLMGSHCDHLLNIYKVDQLNDPIKNAPLIKAIREYNQRQKTKGWNDGPARLKETIRA